MPNLLGLFLVLPSIVVQAAGDIVIDNAWVRESPPGVAVNAAYMDIRNDGKQQRQLVAAQSPDFDAVDIHKTVIKDGRAGMQRQASVSIPAGQTVSLAPGGWHLMLFRSKRAIEQGDHVELLLQFADGAIKSLRLPVHKAAGR